MWALFYLEREREKERERERERWREKDVVKAIDYEGVVLS